MNAVIVGLLLYAAAQMIVGSALGKALARCGGYD
jgi:hypothetical protein